jgi:hypothetical protein
VDLPARRKNGGAVYLLFVPGWAHPIALPLAQSETAEAG